MSRKTLIFGNGLGMALNPESFSLDHAIGVVWKDEKILSDEQKQLICNCLPEGRADRPQGEDDLDKLHIVLSACDLLDGIYGARVHWLSEEGHGFPIAVRNLIYNVARQFFLTDQMLPDEFIGPLCDFVKRTGSHIGTLNYDNLLYQPMIDRGILQGYDGVLVDGFYDAGFHPENLERKYDREFGCYLHLHGSPLFIDQDDHLIKLRQSDIVDKADAISSHIVLTHIDHKPAVISSSDVLRTYWSFLEKAIDESEEIILFGYSGADPHLNSLVKGASGKSVRVIEWSGAGNYKDQKEMWNFKTFKEVELIQLDNIQDFNKWD